MRVDPTEELVERDVETVGQHRQGGDRRHRVASLDGADEGPAERRAHGLLGKALGQPPATELDPDRDRQRGAEPSAGLFTNT